MDNHIYVEDGRLSGIIDWGDAVVIDRHYELAKLCFGTLGCDKGLLRLFLAASAWPVGGTSPKGPLVLPCIARHWDLPNITLSTFSTASPRRCNNGATAHSMISLSHSSRSNAR